MAVNVTDRRLRVLVVGGGIAGAAAARRLGQAGAEVHLIEKQDDIGGHVRELGCKATDVCLRCNVCVADEVLRSVRHTPGVRVRTRTLLADLQPGPDGHRFRAVLGPAARSQPDEAAPTDVAQPEQILDADAIVLATGYDPFDPAENASYGYRRTANVITGMDAERQLAAHRRITRPSDGAEPRHLAFVQCVGSRTEEVFRRPEDTDYCSTVCCAYALRMARRIKYQAPEAEITVFYMDLQNFGKGFDDFYRKSRGQMRFIRSRPYQFREGAEGSVRVTYAPESRADGEPAVCEAEFDLVILAVGIRPSPITGELAGRIGVATDGHGFVGLKGAAALPDLQRDGIFAVGACESPTDIAGCLAQAEAVSAAVLGCPR